MSDSNTSINDTPEYPGNFKQIICDFTGDLTTVFPEFSMLWRKWTAASLGALSEEDLYLEMSYLYEYCTTIFPERFFDILYQNTDIFKLESSVNTCFLPNVEFKLLYNTPGVSETTQKTMWKYLQLILFTIVGSISDKSKFGNSASQFDGVDESELHNKLNETIGGISEFFQTLNSDQKLDNLDINANTTGPDASAIPNPDDIHSHLKGLFDGKIGILAKEMAEDISKDLSGMLEGNGENMTSTKDVLKALMKDPTKITNLIKTVGEKLNSKINSGEISHEELMKEASELLGKMKGMTKDGSGSGSGDDSNPLAGMGDMMDMFKGMMGKGGNSDMMKMAMQMMGKGSKPKRAGSDPFEDAESDEPNPLAGLGEAFKNLGKGRMDTNAMDRMSQSNSTKERLRNKMLMRKAESDLKSQTLSITNGQSSNVSPSYNLIQTDKPDNYTFSLDDSDIQPTSAKPTNQGGYTKPKKSKKGKK